MMFVLKCMNWVVLYYVSLFAVNRVVNHRMNCVGSHHLPFLLRESFFGVEMFLARRAFPAITGSGMCAVEGNALVLFPIVALSRSFATAQPNQQERVKQYEKERSAYKKEVALLSLC